MTERDQMLAFMKEISNALISVRPLGGSELFVKRFDDYFADPAYCKAAIQTNHERYHEAMKETVRLRRALEEVAYPIKAMESRLKPDEKIDGVTAVALANNAEYLRSIALKALAALQEAGHD